MTTKTRFAAFALAIAMTVFNSTFSQAADEGGEEAKPDCPNYAVDVQGTATFTSDPDAEFQPLEAQQCLKPGDLIKTGDDGMVSLQLGAEISIKVNKNSDFQLWNDDENAEIPDQMDFELGSVLTEIAPAEGGEVPFKVNTPSGVVSVKGTEFHVAVDEEGKSEVKVLDGVVELMNELGNVLAEAGQAAELLQGVIPGDAFGFDVAEFQSELDSWAGLLKGGNLKKFIKDKVKDEVKKKLPGGFGGF